MKRTDYDSLKKIIYNEIEREQNKIETTHTEPYDANIYNKGMEWYNSGLSLDEAPDNYRNNIHFVHGYERADRLAKIEENKKNSVNR